MCEVSSWAAKSVSRPPKFCNGVRVLVYKLVMAAIVVIRRDEKYRLARGHMLFTIRLKPQELKNYPKLLKRWVYFTENLIHEPKHCVDLIFY